MKSRNRTKAHSTLEDIYGSKETGTFFMTQVDVNSKPRLKTK